MEDQKKLAVSIRKRVGAFMESCLIGTAADLNLFSQIGNDWVSANEIAQGLNSDRRATEMLLDAVVALELLEKQEGKCRVPSLLQPLLMDSAPNNILPMLWHQANLMRSWLRLAESVQSGLPAPKHSSIRGTEADRAAFVAAMHTHSGPGAKDLVAKLQPLKFNKLLDVGGASGTWTLVFLEAVPNAKAVIFDLPDAIEQARARVTESAMADRIDFADGDFYEVDLPSDIDFAWLGAIIHQHGREEKRTLFKKVYQCLNSGGRIAIRDLIMDDQRTNPVWGALFAINMLVNTKTGKTYTFDEIAEDLKASGFSGPQLAVAAEDKHKKVSVTFLYSPRWYRKVTDTFLYCSPSHDAPRRKGLCKRGRTASNSYISLAH